MKDRSFTKKTSLLWLLAMLCSLSGWAQSQTVTGRVTSFTEGTSLPGVAIRVKGTSTGTITDLDGRYQIQVPGGDAVLVFSFVGYNPEEVQVGTRTTIDVQLAEDIETLSEVVVVGYGTQKKSDLTGSVSSIGEKDFNAGPITSPLQQISGRAAGVNINQVGNEPGQAPVIRVRGITSLIGGNDPLVVVDGIQGNMALLNQIPPSEIQSIEILKDASATAIYGSRGAAGVVMVTTKKGVAGKVAIEYNGVASYDVIAKKYEVLTAAEWRDAVAARGLADPADFGGNTNWFDEVTRNGQTQSHNLAISGGSDNFTYRTSLTAILQEGVINNSGSENYIARFQGSQTALNDLLTVDFNLNANIRSNKYNNAGRIGEALTRRPTDPIYAVGEPAYRDIGNYFIDTERSFNYLNPVARTNEIVDGDRNNDMFGSLRVNYKLLPSLNATVFGSWRRSSREYQQYISARTTQENARNMGTTPEGLSGEELQTAINNLPDGRALRETNNGDEKLFNFILNYNKEIGKHSLDVIGVNEWQQQVWEGYSAFARGFSVDDANNLYVMSSADPEFSVPGNVNSYKNDRTLASFLGRVNYSFDNKYLLSASVRRDGSSVFGANNKWANFYAASAAWRILEEDFMSGVTFLNDLKLRVGYGETGNQQGLSPLNSVTLARADGTVYFGGAVIPNYSITQNANPDLRWEVKRMYNAGIDFALIEGRLSGNVDVFRGMTSDLLFNYNVPQPPYPYGTIMANIGDVLNQGIEMGLNYAVIDETDYALNLGGNFTSIRTEVKELSGTLNGLPLETDYVVWGSGGTTGVASTNNAISHLIIGQPLGTFYLFKHAGVSDNGIQIIDDLNGDGTISDGNRRNEDRYMAGQALPKFNWAFTPSARYKNFDLNMVIRGAHGHKIYNARKATLSAMSNLGTSNVLRSALDANIDNFTYASDYFLEDGDFARMENLTLGYNLTPSRLGAVKNLRLSVTATNLFVITGYTGIDPELSTAGGEGFGIDYGIYPRTRNFAFGLSATF
ncbi:SusC/RagA family TonB-linked outer membrane protein [Cesiribacter andamanensis]|uniref:Outer membrane cobalamin receptor protein n=1 Tax=Cesiribacter andamanensis AMV16 TaxID=1279009 RepID=M7NUP5_9BACT|nr:TonB-dependent receptor [Cesiribacter andamanensis]EMR02189.1 Outer membrane cobalamin receptor protein [Cesiribacter andamanensis AMV16]